MEERSMGPAAKYPIPIKSQSVFITPESCGRPSVRGLFFQHFVVPE